LTIEQLRKVHEAYPFQPFTVGMADGRRFYVPAPGWLSHSPSGRTIIVHQPDDSYSVLDLLLMTELQIVPPPRNGVQKPE
jgi:hypothetical protein